MMPQQRGQHSNMRITTITHTLSSLFFILVVDGLNKIIHNCKHQGSLEGLGAGRNTNSFINLRYANDTLLFCKCDIRQVVILKSISYNSRCGWVKDQLIQEFPCLLSRKGNLL